MVPMTTNQIYEVVIGGVMLLLGVNANYRLFAGYLSYKRDFSAEEVYE